MDGVRGWLGPTRGTDGGGARSRLGIASSARRWLVRGLVVAVAVNAALGIVALGGGEFGDTQRRVLLTSLAVSGTGVLVLACIPALERRRLGPLPYAGIAAAAAGGVLALVLAWLDDPPERLGQAFGTLVVLAVAIAYGSLIGLARLPGRRAWIVRASTVLALVLAALVTTTIWAAGDSSGMGRAIGVVAVLLAAGTVLVPVLHRWGRAPEAGADGARIRFCPSCGTPLGDRGAAAAVHCPRCGASWRIEPGDAMGARPPRPTAVGPRSSGPHG
ncbi:MAG: zinc ribbon domain-containing protein [Thermoleophilia bacterium]